MLAEVHEFIILFSVVYSVAEITHAKDERVFAISLKYMLLNIAG